jgi:hypothetical protein
MGDPLLEHTQTAQNPMFAAINPSNPELGSKALENVSNAVDRSSRCSAERVSSQLSGFLVIRKTIEQTA